MEELKEEEGKVPESIKDGLGFAFSDGNGEGELHFSGRFG
jgi:hypothetical protein